MEDSTYKSLQEAVMEVAEMRRTVPAVIKDSLTKQLEADYRVLVSIC